MNSISVRVCRWYCRCLAVLIGLLAFGTSVFAQISPIVQRLSPNTVVYVEWRGAGFLADAKQKNHVLQLVHDPAFASIGFAAAADFQQHIPNSAGPASASLLPDVMSFLDNSLVFGVVADPHALKAAAPEKPISPFATFMVYDGAGKADLIQKWKARAAANNKAPVDVTKYDFGGTFVEVRTQGKDVSYSAQAGNYFVFSDQKQVVEDLITRFQGADNPAASVTQIPEFAQARKYVGDNAALEFFARIPDLSLWNPTEKDSKSMLQAAKAVHLDRIHVMAGGVSFEGETTRIRGAVLGDASPGGLFDLAGTSSATFQSQPVVEAGSAFSISRMNYAAIYQVVRDAIFGNLPPQQAAQAGALEGAAQGYIGMAIPDALRLFTGEFASASFYTEDGTSEQLYAATIQKPDAVLRILRAVIGTMIVGEDSSGTTTFLDVAYPYTDPSTHQRRRKFYYVAVTPQTLLIAPRKATLREALQRLNPTTADPPAGVFTNPEYAQLRSRLPEKLSGLGGADLTQIPWTKLMQNFASQMAQAANQNNDQKQLDLSSIKLDAISHYLHISVSGWWKDANGVYFDSYIQ
ncbi:MAG TPA: hypothetical protein VEI08_01050 [Candidatus Bathyarchaeia archaeon]|nr:hypothetical protein [Candidatus Bathyarchaeia archaeon]